MPFAHVSLAGRYALAVALPVAGTLLRLLLEPVFGTHLPLISAMPATAVAVWLLGPGPAVVTAVGGYLGALYLIDRFGYPMSTTLGLLPTSIVYAVASTALIVVGELPRRSNRRERVAARQARENARRFSVAQESSLVSFVILRVIRDAYDNIVDFACEYANPAAALALQRPLPQILRQPLLSVLPRTFGGPLLDRLVRVVETGIADNGEITLAADGIDRQFQAVVSRLDDGLSIWFMDITERKRTEVALVAADRRKDEFLATLAHELRNPLAPIRNGLAILARGVHADDAVQQPTIQMMERQVSHLVRLIDDLLEVSRITHGKVELRRQPVTLLTALNAALESCRGAIEARRLQCSTEASDVGLAVLGDNDRLTQVFTNLLSNAVKYTPAGGRIALRLHRDGAEAVVTVRDSGVGIPSGALESIFEMFSQLRPRGTDESGLGIGLALVRRLVQMHGGTVRATSAGEGHGSEFTVRLPLLAAADIAPGTDDTGTSPALDAHRLRVLIVDDNADAADSLAMLLDLDGHDTRCVYGGAEALVALPTFDPDMVVLDIGMPVIDGYEVARRLRAGAGRPGIRLIAVTGWGQAQDKARAQAAGFDAHLTKPVDPAQLKALLPAGAGLPAPRGVAKPA
jgi:signal transduction histidine kinase